MAEIFSLAGDWSIVESTFVYFVLADLVILGTLSIYIITTRTDYFKFYNAQINFESSLDSSESTFDLTAFKLVFQRMWPYCTTLMLTFFTSLSVYPAVVVLVSPQSGHSSTFWNGKFFLPVCCFLTFNVCLARAVT